MYSQSTKICKLCGVRFRGTATPEEVYCAYCFVITCDVPDDTEEEFFKLVNEITPPPGCLSAAKVFTPPKSKARVPEVNNNDTPVTASSSSEEETEVDARGTRNPSGLTRSNSVRDRIKAFEAIERRASTSSYDRKRIQGGKKPCRSLASVKTINFKEPPCVFTSPKSTARVPEVNNNDAPVTASSSSEEETEVDARGTRNPSGLIRSNSVRDRIKAFEAIERRASTGSYDRKRIQGGKKPCRSQASMKTVNV